MDAVDYNSWVLTLASNPTDRQLRLIYADWLDERGDSLGEWVRLQDQLMDISKPWYVVMKNFMFMVYYYVSGLATYDVRFVDRYYPVGDLSVIEIESPNPSRLGLGMRGGISVDEVIRCATRACITRVNRRAYQMRLEVVEELSKDELSLRLYDLKRFNDICVRCKDILNARPLQDVEMFHLGVK